MKIEQLFQKGYYINLDRRVDRNTLFVEELKRVGLLNFFERHAGRDSIAEPDPMKRHKYCGLSHHDLLKKIYDAGHEYVVIFEDDAQFYDGGEKPAMQIIESALDELQSFPDWDMIYFGGIPHDSLEPVSPSLYRSGVVFGTHAIGYRRRIIEKTLKEYNPDTDWVIDAWYSHNRSISKYLVNPVAVIQRGIKSDLDANDYVIKPEDYTNGYKRVRKNKLMKYLSKNFVTCRLQGRTGNMMFQIANAYVMALEHNRQLVIPSNDSSSSHLEKTLFRKLDFSIYTSFDVKFAEVINLPFWHRTSPPAVDRPTIYSGWVQSEKYFGKHKEVVRDLFSPTPDFIKNATEEYPFLTNNTVAAINVRRGDYLTQLEHHPVVSLEYINEAIKRLPPHEHTIVVSDDIEWCKANIKGENMHFAESYHDQYALWLLSLCDHFVISNSSFSWWGAFLSRNPNKVVVAPETWFGPKLNEETRDLYCEGWIKLPTVWKDGYIYPR